jgi:LysM repeat protein
MIRMRPLILVFLLFAVVGVRAQSDMMIQGVSPNLHLSHTVSAKETWYSLGRMYNLPPKDIATYNKGSIEKPLSIGQTIQIPLKPVNFSQDNSSATSDVLVPLYHVVQEKEWMYRISVNHNKVPIENLEKWNNISRDQARTGTKLIVGFLKVKNGQSPAATAAVAKTENTTAQEPKSAVPPMKDLSPIPKETPKKEAATEPKALPPSTSTSTSSQPSAIPPADINFKGGYFKSQFNESGKSTGGVSGIFKSTSGWKDGKYYALMNNVPVGTIVKVNFPSTNKTVYAKVLGQLPDMRESAGLAIRLSEAAATELGASNGKFNVDVNY